MNSTLVVLRLLCGLHGLSDLHADDVDLGLAVLQHLLSRLEKLLVLWKDIKIRGDQEESLKEHRLKKTCLEYLQIYGVTLPLFSTKKSEINFSTESAMHSEVNGGNQSFS